MSNDSREALPRWVIAALAAALLALLAGGTWLYRSQTQYYQQITSDKLMSTARLKSNQIAAWRSERLGDAHILQESPFLAAPVATYLATASEKHKESLQLLFRSMQRHYGYADILLVDTAGRVQLSLSGNRKAHDCYRAALATALRKDKACIHQPAQGATARGAPYQRGRTSLHRPGTKTEPTRRNHTGERCLAISVSPDQITAHAEQISGNISRFPRRQ